ncbi:hypothetical protein YGS_C1P0364 [Sphingobium sp. YG1]|nr:hypothetical protein YGS_C1P0364 [Sphingobium sp. YG1]
MGFDRNRKNRVREGARDLARGAWGGHPPGLGDGTRAQAEGIDAPATLAAQPL